MYILGQSQVNGPVVWKKMPAFRVAAGVAALQQQSC